MIGFHFAYSMRRSNTKGSVCDGSYAPDYSLSAVDLKSFKNNLVDIIQQNKERWKELAAQGTVVDDSQKIFQLFIVNPLPVSMETKVELLMEFFS